MAITSEFHYWDDAALAAVESIFASTTDWSSATVDTLRRDLDRFIDEAFMTPDAERGAAIAHWASLGADAVEISRGRKQPLTVMSVTPVLIRKQRDYGHENIRRFGRQGLMVRLHDKVARLENLLASSSCPNHESIDDTLLDVVGYAAIGIMWEQDQFLLNLISAE